MKINQQLSMINQQYKSMDALYHKAAVTFGMSDSALWVFYSILTEEGDVTQQDLCNTWYFSKQTLNSTVSNLCKNGYLTLEPIPGTRNRKRLLLTKEGKDYVALNVCKLVEAEEKAIEKMSEEHLRQFTQLSNEFSTLLIEQFEEDLH